MSRHGRPALVLPVVLAALSADTSPLGLTHAQLQVATGLPSKQLSSALRILKKTGRLFALGVQKDSRFFSTANRLEQCRPAWDEFMAQVRAARKARENERERTYRRANYKAWRKEFMGPPKSLRQPVKVQQRAKPKPRQKPIKVKRAPAPVLVGKMRTTVARSERPKTKDERPVVIPAHVRIQHCPSSKDTRYSVPVGFVGEFAREWRAKRACNRSGG